MFDISAKFVSEQDEINGVKTIDWEDYSWKYLSLIVVEQVISLQRTKVYVFSDSVLCLGKILENTQSNDAWEQRLGWLKSSENYRNFDRIDGESMEFEWNIFPGFNTLQLSQEFKSSLLRLDGTPENLTGRSVFMSMFIDISWGSRDNEKECESNANLVSLYAKTFGIGQWSFLGLVSEKTWSPLSRGQLKSKGGGKMSIHYCADLDSINTIFRTITSVNQPSLYGAVAEMCEFLIRAIVIKTEVPLDCDDRARKDLLLQQYGERIEKVITTRQTV